MKHNDLTYSVTTVSSAPHLSHRAALYQLRDALETLLGAIEAKNQFGDRALTINGPVSNVRELFDAENGAHEVLSTIAAAGFGSRDPGPTDWTLDHNQERL